LILVDEIHAIMPVAARMHGNVHPGFSPNGFDKFSFKWLGQFVIVISGDAVASRDRIVNPYTVGTGFPCRDN